MVNKYFRFAFVLVFIFLLVSPTMKTYAADEGPWVIEVDDFSDAPDYVHNSVCSARAITGGGCTLRAAIDEANKCPADSGACEWGVIIKVPPGTYTLTIPPDSINDNSTGDLDIYNPNDLMSYVIEGTDPANPPIIDANELDRVIHVLNSSTPIVLRNLIIKGGYLIIFNENAFDQYGAGIKNHGILNLENVVIENNMINYVSGTYNICQGGIGGGLYSDNFVTMNTSTVRNNFAMCGGGIAPAGGSQMKIYNSTISGNMVVYNGGGVYNYGTINMQNSTVSDNAADSTGGIHNHGTINLYNVTIANNFSFNGSAANLLNIGPLTISNSIVAYPISLNTTYNCENSGSWTAAGNNLYSDSSCGTGPGILSNTDPKLTPLAWLGGPTMTRGLLPGSPAHDAGINFCMITETTNLTSDQRGANRDSHCDLGAFEGVAYGVYLPMIRR